MSKSLYIILIILFVLSLSSCAHKIPDEPICLELNGDKGYCTYTIRAESYYLLGQEWQNQKRDSLILPVKSWVEIKKFILNICKDYGKCVEAESKIQEIDQFIY